MKAPDMTPERLAGTWHIVCSSFPMWLGGKRRDPTFTYTPLPGGGREASRMRDEVRYRAGNRTRRIAGTDTRLTTRSGTVYRWRGRGLLSLFTSEWSIPEVGDDDAWAVITFTRSLATPSGTDVVVRSTHLTDPTVLAAALTAGTRHGAPPLPGRTPEA